MPKSLTRRTLPLAGRALMGAVSLAAVLLGGGCAEPTAVSDGGLAIHGLQLSAQRLVGREGFDVTVRVQRPMGSAITAYVLTTPYEHTRHVLEVPLTPIEDGYIVLQEVQFDREPVTGPYPVEIRLEDETGDRSNALSGQLIVQ